MTRITDPRDPRLQDPSNYAAVAVAGSTFRGVIAAAARHGPEIVDLTEAQVSVGLADHLDIAIVQAETHAMLSTGSGERFPVGDHDLIALRYIVDGHHCTILYVEDYIPSYPCLVDGHVADRDSAITLWLGDGDSSEHPDLYLTLGDPLSAMPQVD